MSVDAADIEEGTSELAADGDRKPSSRRSLWRVSLGGILVFAAGMMVGFAPMRAWLFLRDEPDFVEIDVRLFDVNASESDAVRRAFSEARSNDDAPELDLDQILASRAPSAQWLSKPMITTMMNREARLQIVAQRYPRTSAGPPASYQPDVIDASFTPSVRPSGMLELQYRIKHTATRVDEGGTAVGSDEVSTESSAVVENGVWHLIEVRSPSRSDVENGRSRWLMLRAKPIETTR